MEFVLHSNLAKKTFIMDLPLSRVLFEDNQYYPWIFLVPQRNNISRIMDLSWNDQVQLLKEMDWAQKTMWELFKPTQLNVAAIGNKTPQLHVHIIARFDEKHVRGKDPAWPGTVWDHSEKKPYDPKEKEQLIAKIKENLQNRMQ